MCSIWSVLALSLVITLAYGQGVPGGYNDVTLDKNDPTVAYMVKGVNSMFAKNGDNSGHSIQRVVKARGQVVAGMKYELIIEVSNKQKTYQCTAEIGVQLWMPEPDIYRFVSGPTCTRQ